MERTIRNPVIGDVVTFVETAAESGGERTLLDIELVAGGGNAPHRHLTYGERFEAVEGTLTIELGKQLIDLAPGETAFAPPRSLHRFLNQTGETIRFLVELTPGHEGFERALRIAYGLAEDGATRADGALRSMLQTAVLAKMSDIRPGGPLALFTPVLGVLSWIGRRRGVEEALVERYAAVAHDADDRAATT
jgi:mannose-6-phosphate isomerase-like protein (cupin superfamily)